MSDWKQNPTERQDCGMVADECEWVAGVGACRPGICFVSACGMSGSMAMTIIKVAELSGCSEESWSDAVRQTVIEAMRLLQPIISDDAGKPVANRTLTRLDEYRATVSVAFILESRSPGGMLMSGPAVFERVISTE